MRRARLILLAVCVFCGASRLPAQWQFTADAGAAHVRQMGIPESNAWTVGATLDALGERTALRSRLLGSQAGQTWTGQALVLGSIVGSTAPGPSWELTGGFSAFGESNTASTTSGEGMARLRLAGLTTGASIGVGAGAVSNSVTRHAMVRGQAIGWWNLARNQILGDASFVATAADSITNATRYADISATWRRDHRGIEFGATAGVRAGWIGVESGGWGSVDAAAWVAPNLAVVASAGRSLEDVPRGIPRTQYVSVALRIAARGHTIVGDPRPPVPAQTVVTRSGVSVRVDSASRVELMADFTEWAVVVLERSDSAWTLERVVPPGLHRVAIRVDGGEWTSPPGLPRTTDDLGGVVGLVTVP